MKVAVNRQSKSFDVHVGDIIRFDGSASMIIDLGDSSDYYGVLALEGCNAGKVVTEFLSLYHFDANEKLTEELIKCDDVVISNGE